jgi:hypothetical protein
MGEILPEGISEVENQQEIVTSMRIMPRECCKTKSTIRLLLAYLFMTPWNRFCNYALELSFFGKYCYAAPAIMGGM